MGTRIKTILFALLALCAPCFPVQADIIGFTGPFNPGTWTTAFLGTLNLSAGGGPGSTSMTPNALTLVGGDTGVDPNTTLGCSSGSGTCEIDITHAGAALFRFHWSYTTLDEPTFDPFGMLVDGVHVQLAGVNGTSGDVVVGANSSFGWYVNCTDCSSGAATALITAFQAPEPTSLALVALAWVMFVRARRRAAA